MEEDSGLTSIFLSSSEFALFELARSSGQGRLKGEEVRFIDIPAIVDKNKGVFESVPESYSPAALSEEIETACRKFYGIAGREFVRNVVENYDDVGIRLNQLVDEFISLADLPNKGWERRFAKRFALSYAAGRMGIEFNILPWPEQLVQEACLACYQDARQAIPDFEQQLPIVLDTLKNKLRKPKLFRDLRVKKQSDKAPSLQKACGFIKTGKKGGLFYAIKPQKFKRWCGEVPYSLVAQHLLKQGHLVTTTRDLPTKQILVTGMSTKKRYYCIKESFLED